MLTRSYTRLKAETHYATNLALRHVAATGCCNKSPHVTCENHCCCDRILSLRSVARIQTGLNSCDISQRHNKRKRPWRSVCTLLRQVAATNLNQLMRERQLFNFGKLVHISPLPNRLRAPNKCLVAATCRSSGADEATCRRDVPQRFVAQCVSALTIPVGLRIFRWIIFVGHHRFVGKKKIHVSGQFPQKYND